MELKKLLEGVEVRKIIGEAKREIEGIAYHSHQVRERFLFAALQGLAMDGKQFIKESVERGADVILSEKEDETIDRTLVLVPNSRQALAKIASNFYGNPSAKIFLVGITGTNGKTTTTYLLESILKKAGYGVGVIGTINYRYGQKVIPAFNTTPESLDLQRILWEMLGEGITHVMMEVSSHGLDLHRVFGCQFDGAVFTNLTSEHLDYHQTLGRYFESKRRLFSESLMKSLKPGRFAVTNHDDPRGEEIVKGISLPILRYGLNSSCDISARDIHSSFEGITCQIKTPNGEFPLHSKLIGRFNLYNILTAIATGFGMGLSLEILREGVEGLEGVSGRFEKVTNRRGIHIVVDYAHTDDALERVLLGLKDILNHSPQDDGKIITVFGCGGDRDRTKRPRMGKVAGKYSDLVLLTSDNPRTEDPLTIMDEVEKGLEALYLKEWDRNKLGAWRSEKRYLKIPDRKEAIRMAIQVAQPRDAVLIAGKGHEDYQIIGKQRIPFDDRVEARKALEEV
jgi:UDP-N-acetylmuramoyl-L-alanyl-D-glutamate--2,6-diaminopimelate ligase